MTNTYEVMKQLIDSALQNLDWETNLQYKRCLYHIMNLIEQFHDLKDKGKLR